MKALWNGQIIAESDATIIIEGNHYFPPSSVQHQLLQPSQTHTFCPWKGEASYYTLTVDGQTNPDAAWYYPQPKESAITKVKQDFSNYIAFWHGVDVVA